MREDLAPESATVTTLDSWPTEIMRSRDADRPVRIVLADDSFLTREAIKHLLAGTPKMHVVGECEEATAVPEALDRHRADVLLADIRMPPAGHDQGIVLAARLRETHPALGVVVLSVYAEVAYALALFERGCDGRAYLLKDRIRGRDQLTDAVRAVSDGGSVTDPTIVRDLVRHHQANGLDDLTARELETLALIAEGLSNAMIAERLVVTKRAVEKHVNAIFAKLALGDVDQISPRVTAALMYLSAHGGSER